MLGKGDDVRRRGLFRLLALMLAACLALAACAAGSSGDSSAVGSDSEASSARATGPLEGIDAESRVVALSRSVGEMWLLAGGDLVGITEDGLGLDELRADVAVVGSLARPSLEQVLALEPDLVLVADGIPAHGDILEGAREAGIAALVVDVNSFADYESFMEQFVACTGRADLFERNVTHAAQGIEDILTSYESQGDTYLALRVSATKNKVLKSDYFACAMLDDLGMQNVANDSSALDDLSLEAIAAADPDWIFVVYQGDDEEARQAYLDAFESNPVWSELRAVREGHVVVLPKDLFQYKPNARWAEAYAYLVEVVGGA